VEKRAAGRGISTDIRNKALLKKGEERDQKRSPEAL